MVDPEIIAVSPTRQNIFYTCSTRPHTGDDIIKVLLLLCTAKLQINFFQFTRCHCGHCILTIKLEHLTSKQYPLVEDLLKLTCLLDLYYKLQ